MEGYTDSDGDPSAREGQRLCRHQPGVPYLPSLKCSGGPSPPESMPAPSCRLVPGSAVCSPFALLVLMLQCPSVAKEGDARTWRARPSKMKKCPSPSSPDDVCVVRQLLRAVEPQS